MLDKITALENELNSFDSAIRSQALEELNRLLEAGQLETAPDTLAHNLHCHTFFSYNGYGFSPSYIVWIAKKAGHFAVGCVDFDVLDAVDEFLAAAELLGIRAVCGLETRVFINELADKEINSPGEPGVSYHMGVGFTSSRATEPVAAILAEMSATAQSRTEKIVELVNGFMTEIALDFAVDARVLTPAGNVTERHVCEAYRLKAETIFPETESRVAFWADKLSMENEAIVTIIDDAAAMEALIRSKTMKSGGVGYVKANPDSFPTIESMNALSAACGALPTIAWLNGESAGESDPEALVALHIAKGAAAINIIPDRNWNFADADVKTQKTDELNRVIAAAKKCHLPIIIGTEMNAPGLKLVDDFTCEALAPYVDDFVDGAAIMFAHTLLSTLQMGYLSEWATANFNNDADKYQFYAQLGRAATTDKWNLITKISADKTPTEILELLK
ncbi:MAG: PHP domain-containing protein [Victivallaceae bacterium]|nr:PHP domain-containing protein [Victivallaceae bacterium]